MTVIAELQEAHARIMQQDKRYIRVSLDRNTLRYELDALRERHAEAVEQAFREGFAAGADAKGMAVSWHWAEAKARLT